MIPCAHELAPAVPWQDVASPRLVAGATLEPNELMMFDLTTGKAQVLGGGGGAGHAATVSCVRFCADGHTVRSLARSQPPCPPRPPSPPGDAGGRPQSWTSSAASSGPVRFCNAATRSCRASSGGSSGSGSSASRSWSPA